MTVRRSFCWFIKLTCFGLFTISDGSRAASESDLRRDATVEAVQRVFFFDVTTTTETVVPIRDPLENLFRDFFNPYYRNRPADTQFSLGSGAIIDEEAFVLTTFHL